MHDQPAAARAIERAKWTEDGLSAQQLFDRQRSRRPRANTPAASAGQRVLAQLRQRGARRSTPAVPRATSASLPRHLEGLEAAGCVTLDDVRAGTRTWVDHLVVAPTGVYAVQYVSLRGQVDASDDALFVDGRKRSGVLEEARHAAAGVHAVLADELTPLGVGVTPVVCLPPSDLPWQQWTVDGVIVVTGRGIARQVRVSAPLMGRDTVVRVALAAERLLGER
jgi:hypothetical protein